MDSSLYSFAHFYYAERSRRDAVAPTGTRSEHRLMRGAGAVSRNASALVVGAWRKLRDRPVTAKGSIAEGWSGRLQAAGSSRVKTEPLPRLLSTVTVPDICSTMCFTMASPMPLPPVSRDRDLSTQ